MNYKFKGIIALLLIIIDLALIISIVGPEIVETYTKSKIDYSFYMLIKWIIFLSSIVLIFVLYWYKHNKTIWAVLIIPILFNPFFIISLYSRNAWLLIDIAIIIFSILKIFEEPIMKALFPKKYNPKNLVNLLSRFTLDSPIKYSTHLWDFGGLKKEFGSFEYFLSSINEEWKSVEEELKKLSPNLHEKIYNFLLNKENNKSWCSKTDISVGWSSLKGLDKWCNKGNNPFEFKLPKEYEVEGETITTFGEVISLFKREIEIRNENNMLEEIFLVEKQKLGRKFRVELINLKGKSFYTDVEKFRNVIGRIFDEMKKRQDYSNIEVKCINKDKDFMELKIMQIDSEAGRDAEEMFEEVNDGDWKILKESLSNLCDWSIESSNEDKGYRVNYLQSSLTKEIEALNEVPKGFTHILRFYK